MSKTKLQLADLITDKKLSEMQKEFRQPNMTKQEAYAKKRAITNYLDTLKPFKLRID